jgi:hypothetical protein
MNVRARPRYLGAFAIALPLIAAAPQGLPFQVSVPDGFEVVVRDGPDFTLYYINKGEVTYVGVYDGFFPQWGDVSGPWVQQDVTCKDGQPIERNVLLRFGGLPGVDAKVINQDGKPAGETALRVETNDTRVLHVWALEGDGRRLQAEAILASISIPGNPGLRLADLKPCSM